VRPSRGCARAARRAPSMRPAAAWSSGSTAAPRRQRSRLPTPVGERLSDSPLAAEPAQAADAITAPTDREGCERADERQRRENARDGRLQPIAASRRGGKWPRGRPSRCDDDPAEKRQRAWPGHTPSPPLQATPMHLRQRGVIRERGRRSIYSLPLGCRHDGLAPLATASIGSARRTPPRSRQPA